MSTINITLVKSTNGSLKVHKDTVKALGLKKIGQTVTLPDNESTRGMVFRVAHLVKTNKD